MHIHFIGSNWASTYRTSVQYKKANSQNAREKIKQQSCRNEKHLIITSTKYIIKEQRERLEKLLSKVDKMLLESDTKAEKNEVSIAIAKATEHKREN